MNAYTSPLLEYADEIAFADQVLAEPLAAMTEEYV